MFIPEAAPERTTVPEAPSIDELLVSHKPEINVDVGEALDPSPASIEKRIRRSTLATGLRIALVPKGTRGNRVQASLTLRFGDEHSLLGRNAAAQLSGALLMRGTKNKSRQQIQDEMQKLNATITVNGGLSSATASISTTAENLMPAMRLAVEILREPAFPASDFDQIRTQRIAQIDRSRAEPGTLVSQTLQSTLSPYPRTDVRHVRTIDEEIEDLNKVTLDDVKKFHQQFYGASQVSSSSSANSTRRRSRRPPPICSDPGRAPAPTSASSPATRTFSPSTRRSRRRTRRTRSSPPALRLRMRDTDPDYPPPWCWRTTCSAAAA